MESPKKTLADFEHDGVLKPVAETAQQIALRLGSLGYDAEVTVPYGTILYVLIDEETPLSAAVYNEIERDFASRGLSITFHEEEQTIKVAPYRN